MKSSIQGENMAVTSKNIFFGMVIWFAFFFILFIPFSTCCNKEKAKNQKALTEKINSETIAKPISDEKKSEQNLMLGMLFDEAEKSVKNAWAINLNHYFDSATIDKENKTIYFNTNPYLEGRIDNKNYVLKDAVYIVGGFSACEIGKTNSFEIIDRFGKPMIKEPHETKYIYANTKDNAKISFLFDSNGILKNIVVNFDM